ncbi:MAG: hypothetical protein ACXWK2_07500, partial [Rhizomicrobium sp.]
MKPQAIGSPARIRAGVLTAGSALFILDAMLIAIAWPMTMWLAVNRAQHGPFQALVFAVIDLSFLFALGLYRRDSIADTTRALGRVPLVVAIGVAASNVLTAALGAVVSPGLFIWALLCFTGCAMLARIVFRVLRHHRLFRPHLLVVGA